MAGKPKEPNLVLRRIREQERHQSRAEFAESLAATAKGLGDSLTPSERYIARLEDGDIRYPNPAYRRALAELCGKPIYDLGFHGREAGPQALGSPLPALANSSSSLAIWHGLSSTTMPDQVACNPSSADSSEWPMRFGLKIAHLISLVDRWQLQGDSVSALQAILTQEIMMYDINAPRKSDRDYLAYALSRQQALMTLAALPLAFASTVLSHDSRRFSAARESFLAQCAASITGCWHLLRGSDLDAVDHVLSSFLIPLEGIARQNSKHQHTAATLASQTHRARGIVALHRGQISMREHHCKQAYYYATVAADTASQASALISLASTYFYTAAPQQAAAVYERALGLESELTPLQRSRVQAELSVVYGQLDRVKDAVRAAETAGENYPESPEEDPSYLYAEFTPASLALERGLAYLALAQHHGGSRYQHKATEVFMDIDESESQDVPDRIRFGCGSLRGT
jgi:tetratricopeptide (TPR) repeat protein